MRGQTAMCIGWPSFLAACALEMLVFGFVDPQDLHGLGGDGGPSRQGVYALAFLAFWIISAAAVGMGLVLGRSNPPDTPAQR